MCTCEGSHSATSSQVSLKSVAIGTANIPTARLEAPTIAKRFFSIQSLSMETFRPTHDFRANIYRTSEAVVN